MIIDAKWTFVKDRKPLETTRVWIYMPFWPEQYKFNIPEVIKVHWNSEKQIFDGIGDNCQPFVIAWYPWIEEYSSTSPRYIRPDNRSTSYEKEIWDYIAIKYNEWFQ